MNGPFPCGSCPDIKIFRLGLKNKLGPMEKVVADRGYKGNSRICTPDDAKDREQRKAMGFLRARHETFNGRLKTGGVYTKPTAMIVINIICSRKQQL